MDIYLYLAFIGSTIILGLIPGPNIALIVANSISYGARYGLVSVAGTSSAMVPQLIITILGASTLLAIMADWFEWLRWLGVAYLLYLAVQHFLKKEDDVLELSADDHRAALKQVYWRGFWVSASNPKTLLFFGAFLPQFVSPEGNMLQQMIILSCSFVLVITLVDSIWALLAAKMRNVLQRMGYLRHKISGVFFLLAGVGLALARKS